MYLQRHTIIALINLTVLFLVNGCDNCSSLPDSTQSNFSNSHDEECKKIIRVINRKNSSINAPDSLPPLSETPSLPELTAENTSEGNLPKPQRFNSRKATGKTAQELQQEADEKAKQEQAKKWQQWDEQANQQVEQAKQQKDRLLKKLDTRIEDVQAVELSDSQLKNLQTQLVQAYQQDRQANAMFTLYEDFSSQFEQSTNLATEKLQEDWQKMEQQKNSSLEKLEEDLQQREQQTNKQIQQLSDASSKVQTANSALNKYCGLE